MSKKKEPGQQQGRQANQNGEVFEEQIKQRLLSSGYKEMWYKPKGSKVRMKREIIANPTEPYFIRKLHKPFLGYCGNKVIVDFYCWHPQKYPDGLVIECKYQDTPGSVDEKLVYTAFSMIKRDIPGILLIIGNGFKKDFVSWCLSQADEKFKVYVDFTKFMSECNKGLF